MCIFKLPFCEKLFSQYEHLYGFFPSWTEVMCIFKPFFSEKLLSHNEHLYGFFPSCLESMCIFKLPFCEFESISYSLLAFVLSSPICLVWCFFLDSGKMIFSFLLFKLFSSLSKLSLLEPGTLFFSFSIDSLKKSCVFFEILKFTPGGLISMF